jgi:copper homeostasis protein (lipoprotein)
MALIVGLTSCETRRSNSSSTTGSADSMSTELHVGDNSEVSVDWAGTYLGVLPCADCPGIRTSLTLNEDNSFKKVSKYLDRNVEPRVETGKFSWDGTGSKITLTFAEEGATSEQYLVGENQLFVLDGEGKRIEGELADFFILKKGGVEVEEVYWELVELNGQAVDKSSLNREPFLRLSSTDARVEANGGCNSMGGSYELNKELNRIKFGQLMSTKMACPNMDIEQQLAEVLGKADSYHMANDTLQLFRARMAPLAKFVAH